MKDQLRKFVIEGRVKDAITTLIEFTREKNFKAYNEVYLVAARLKRLESDRAKGVIRPDDTTVDHMINEQLLNIIDKIDPTPDPQPFIRKIKFHIHYFLYYYGVAFSIIFWISLITTGIFAYRYTVEKLEIALHFSTERLSFSNLEKFPFHVNQKIAALNYTDFEEVSLPAYEISMKANSRIFQDGSLVFSSIPDNMKNTKLLFTDPIYLKSLEIYPNSTITLDIDDSEQLSIHTTGQLTGIAHLPDSISFEVKNMQLNHDNEVLLLPTNQDNKGTIYGQNDYRDILFKNDSKTEAKLSMKIAKNTTFTKLENLIKGKDFDFKKPNNNTSFAPISCLQKSKIYFLNKNTDYYDSLVIKKGDYLDFTNDANMSFKELTIGSNKISGELIGLVDTIHCGKDHTEELPVRNPSYLRYIWANYTKSIISGLIIIIVVQLLLFYHNYEMKHRKIAS